MSLAQALSFSNACRGQVRHKLDPRGSAGAVPAAVSGADPRAARVHRQHFDPTAVQISALLSIKTGGCPPQRLRRIANARS